MVVVVQQPLAEFTAIFTVCIVEHHQGSMCYQWYWLKIQRANNTLQEENWSKLLLSRQRPLCPLKALHKWALFVPICGFKGPIIGPETHNRGCVGHKGSISLTSRRSDLAFDRLHKIPREAIDCPFFVHSSATQLGVFGVHQNINKMSIFNIS